MDTTLAIFVKPMIPFASRMVFGKDYSGLKFMFEMGSQIGLLFFANTIRRVKNCPEYKIGAIGKSAKDAIILNAFIELTSALINMAINFTPIGIQFRVMRKAYTTNHIIDSILWIISFLIVYNIAKYIDNRDLEYYCSDPFITGPVEAIIVFLSFCIMYAIHRMGFKRPPDLLSGLLPPGLSKFANIAEQVSKGDIQGIGKMGNIPGVGNVDKLLKRAKQAQQATQKLTEQAQQVTQQVTQQAQQVAQQVAPQVAQQVAPQVDTTPVATTPVATTPTQSGGFFDVNAMIEKAKQKATQLAQQAKQQATQLAQKTTQQATQLAQKTTQQATQLAQKTTQQATQLAQKTTQQLAQKTTATIADVNKSMQETVKGIPTISPTSTTTISAIPTPLQIINKVMPTEASTVAAPKVAPTEASTKTIPTEASTVAAPTTASTVAAPTTASTKAMPTEASTVAAPTTATPIVKGGGKVKYFKVK
jgi:vacuolar-type H+-ATPase subunit H